MYNFNQVRKICIIGAGTAGWFAALQMRQIFNLSVQIQVISAPEIPIVGVGEGGILNLVKALSGFQIPLKEFMQETGAVHKLGFAYQGWRTGHHDDLYYHMFPRLSAKEEILNGFYPKLSLLVNQNIPVSYIADSIFLRENNISQQELTDLLIEDKLGNFLSSFHFDTYKVGQYLKKVALQRHVTHLEAKVQDVFRHANTGFVEALNVDGQRIDCDFVIDASGFQRLIVEKTFKTEWCDLSDRLVMNKAIPFHLKHPQTHPDLVTLSTAMSSGWVWQIPLQQRVGAGYVFNDDFINEDQAVKEVEQWLGHAIEPIRTISFDAGYFKKIWDKNVLTIGLASGFVEPLEATSIAQMLMQLQSFALLITETQGILSNQIIQSYNDKNNQSWEGIADFIRMHYDTSRNDTPFWRSTRDIAVSEKYKEFKACWQYRTTRRIDSLQYHMHSDNHFGTYSWLAIAQALNHIDAKVTKAELASVSEESREKLLQFLHETRQRLGRSR